MPNDQRLARDVSLIGIAEAITDLKESSLSYTALVAFREEMDEFEEEIQAQVGSPLTAETAADMTDTSKIYVYVGNETGYQTGYWYYYDNSTTSWKVGNIYNAVAIDTATMEEIIEYIG